MDVRSGDTTSLAAKRVEMEKAERVKQKQQGSSAEDQIATDTAAKSNGHVSRPKPPENPRDRKKGRPRSGEGRSTDVEKPPADSPSKPTGDKRHLLDVKV